MEANKEAAPNNPESPVVQEKTSSEAKKPKLSKRAKILITVCILLGLFALIGAPALLIAINPLERLRVAQINTCTNECSSSSDSMCVNKCLESRGSTARVTPAQISEAPVEVSPSPTAAPTISVAKTSSISKAPTLTPTPAGPPTLVIKTSKGVNTVTLLNQSTGKTMTESISSPGKNYYVEPGAYRITFNEVQNCRATYSVCYENCSMTSGHWGWDENGNVANVNVEAGKTHAASLYYVDPSSSTNPGTTCKSLQ